MFTSNYFDICTVDSCAKLCGVIIDAKRRHLYHTQHCIYYDQMLPDFRESLIGMVLDDFRDVLNPQAERIVNEVAAQ